MIAGNPFIFIPNSFVYYGLNKPVSDPVSIICQSETTLMNSRERRHFSNGLAGYLHGMWKFFPILPHPFFLSVELPVIKRYFLVDKEKVLNIKAIYPDLQFPGRRMA